MVGTASTIIISAVRLGGDEIATDGLGRVLIVDDEPDVVSLLQELLERYGCEVDTAATGPEALTAFLSGLPDVVLLDLRLPEMSGAEVFRRMRIQDRTLPIVIISASEDVDLARALLAQGAFDYVTKPFDLAYLDRVVATALSRAPNAG
jgi:DNA-binding response OmpR family regulator